jgi:hypothetical protein
MFCSFSFKFHLYLLARVLYLRRDSSFDNEIRKILHRILLQLEFLLREVDTGLSLSLINLGDNFKLSRIQRKLFVSEIIITKIMKEIHFSNHERRKYMLTVIYNINFL